MQAQELSKEMKFLRIFFTGMELPGNFLQGWNYSGIFYRDKILECDDKQGLVSPGRLSPLDQGILVSFMQGFWW